MFTISGRGNSTSVFARFLSMLLVAALLLTSLPTVAFASDAPSGVSATAASMQSEESTSTPVIEAPEPPATPDAEEAVDDTDLAEADEASDGVEVAAEELEFQTEEGTEEEEEELEEISALNLQVGARYLMDFRVTSSANNGTTSAQLNPLFNNTAVVQVTPNGNIVTFYHDNSPMIAGFPASPPNIEGYLYDPTQAQAQADALPHLRSAIRQDMNAAQTIRAVSINWADVETTTMLRIERVVGHMGTGLTGAPLNVFLELDPDSAVRVTDNAQLPHPDFAPPAPPVEMQVGNTYLLDLTVTSSANNGTVSAPMNPMFNDRAVVQVTEKGNIVTFYHDSTRMQAGVLASPSNITGYRYSSTQDQGPASGAGLMPPNMNPAIREVLNTDESARAISVNWPDASLPQLIHIERVAGHMGNPAGAPMNLFFVLDADSAVQVTDNAQLPHPDFGLVNIEPPICANPCTPYCDICRPVPPVCANPCVPYCDVCRPAPPVCGNPCVPYCDICRPPLTTGMQVGNTYLVNFAVTGSANDGVVSPLLDPLFNNTAVVQVTPSGNVVTFYLDGQRSFIDVTANASNVRGFHFSAAQSQTPAAGDGTRPAGMVPALREVLNTAQTARAVSVNWSDANRPMLVHVERLIGHMGSGNAGAPINMFMVLDISAPIRVTNNNQLPHPGLGLPDVSGPGTGGPGTGGPGTGGPGTGGPGNGGPGDTAGVFQMGRTYLVNVRALNTSQTGPSILAGMYYPRAVVEVTPQGNFVSFFHSNIPVVNGERATPAAVYGYAFDGTTPQSTARPPASAMIDAVREELNANRSVKCITVRWPDLNRTLFLTIDHVPGMPAELGAAPFFMSLDTSTARLMTNHPFPEFGTTDPAGTTPQAVNKAALQRLVNRAAGIDGSRYTELSFAALTTELRNARSVLTDRNATQRNVNTAYTSLRQALDNLVRRPSGETVDRDNMTDGRYTVRVDFWHATNNAPSMANDALNKTGIIDVRGNTMTMSISTRPIRVGQTTTTLGTLQVHGRTANVTSRNLFGGRPSAFSFNLPNTNSFHPVVFWLDPRIEQTPRPDLPGRLRISWDTLRRADGAVLSANVATVDASVAALEDIERTAELAEGVAPEPVLAATPAATAAELAARAAEAAAANRENAARLPWLIGTLGAGLLLGIVAATWMFMKKRYDGKVETKISGD